MIARQRHTGPANAAEPLREALPPIADPRAEILILGSMPGPASLAAQAYYAHPQNAFWPILGALLEFDAAMPYPARLAALQSHGIALWDVLARCRRQGAADTAIRDAEANDFAGFFAAHRQLRRICFNGGAAAALFRRHVTGSATLQRVQLPWTSPAYAAMSVGDKRERWKAGLFG